MQPWEVLEKAADYLSLNGRTHETYFDAATCRACVKGAMQVAARAGSYEMLWWMKGETTGQPPGFAAALLALHNAMPEKWRYGNDLSSVDGWNRFTESDDEVTSTMRAVAATLKAQSHESGDSSVQSLAPADLVHA